MAMLQEWTCKVSWVPQKCIALWKLLQQCLLAICDAVPSEVLSVQSKQLVMFCPENVYSVSTVQVSRHAVSQIMLTGDGSGHSYALHSYLVNTVIITITTTSTLCCRFVVAATVPVSSCLQPFSDDCNDVGMSNLLQSRVVSNSSWRTNNKNKPVKYSY